MKERDKLFNTLLFRMVAVWVGVGAVFGLIACGDDAAQTGVQCAANAPEIVAACPAGTRAVVNAQARDLCEGAASGAYNPIDGGEAGVEGACTASGSCVVLCEFLEPCTCGVATISQDEVVCAACGACGNDVCDPGESTDSCPQDCGGRCEIGRERCNGAHREVCNARQQWETLECPGETRCRELEGATTECRAESACTCDEVSACCDGCRARGVGDPCEDDLFCQEGSTCQDDGTCGGGTSRACDEAITAPQCQIASCDEVSDRCVALPANEGDLCDNPDTLSQDHCVQGVCLADGCACDAVDDCCDGCQPRNVAESCDDGLFCTTGTTCDAAGACVGAARDCAGELEATTCQHVTCDEDTDACVAVNDPDALGAPCEDGVFCTVGTTCQEDGSCGAGQPRDCSDAVSEPQCQGDPICNEDARTCGAEPANEGQSCDDGDARTLNDVCLEGQCVGGPCPCGPVPSACCDGCQPINLGDACDDGLFCSEATTCQADGACGGGQARECGAPDDPQCQSDPVCDESVNRCVSEAANEGMTCDDGNPLSADDVCIAGVCRGVPPHALIECDGEDCAFSRCQVGWDDADLDCLAGGDCANGCEACLPIGDGSIELPDDGIDNDCEDGAEPVNDDSRGFYIDPAFTPAGNADCDNVPRGNRDCPFTDIYDAVIRAEDEPWGTLDPVRRELYLAQGRYELDETIEIYNPLIIIGGYEPTDSGPWLNRGVGTEIVRNDDLTAIRVNVDHGAEMVFDRLKVSPRIEGQAPSDGLLVLVRVEGVSEAEPLHLNLAERDECDILYLHQARLHSLNVYCSLARVYDSIVDGVPDTGARDVVRFSAGEYGVQASRNLFRHRGAGPDDYIGNFATNYDLGAYFVGNTVDAGYSSVNDNCHPNYPINAGLVYGNDFRARVYMVGGRNADRTRVARNVFHKGLDVSRNSDPFSDQMDYLKVEDNLIVYPGDGDGVGLNVVELTGNAIYSEGTLYSIRATTIRHNTIFQDDMTEGGRPFTIALGGDGGYWDPGNHAVESNVFALLGSVGRWSTPNPSLGDGLFNLQDALDTSQFTPPLHSIRNNVFYIEQEGVPYLYRTNSVIAESLNSLNRYGELSECGRGGNMELSELAELRWYSIDPAHPDFLLPAPDSPLINAGLSLPDSCDGVEVQAPEHDLLGNPRVCGEGIDVGAFEYCP